MKLCFAVRLVLFPFGLAITPWMRPRHCQAAHRVSCTYLKSCLQTLFDISHRKHDKRILNKACVFHILLSISYKISMLAARARRQTDASFVGPHFVWHATILNSRHVLHVYAGRWTARPVLGLKVYRLSDFSNTGIQGYLKFVVSHPSGLVQ